MKRLILAAVLSLAIATPIRAETCHDLVMSYIYHDQDPPQQPGDILYEGGHPFPVLLSTTGYYYGSHGSHGDKMRSGYCAYTSESYGAACIVYEALPQEDGSFQMGDYLTTLEIKDTGYGYPTGQGKSKVRPDKKSQGSIEAGESLDVYNPTLSGCREWMKLTKGYVFAVIVPAEG